MSTSEPSASSSASTASGDAKAVAGTAAFSKFIAVLQLIADADTPPNIAKLVAASGYPRPTVHRIVAALQAEGLVTAVGGGNTFALGTRLVSLASRSWERSDLRIAAVDALMELRNSTSETVHLAVPSDGAMVYIEKLESPHAVRMASRIGTRVTLTSSSVGKAWLATLTPAEREPLLQHAPRVRFTEHTMTDLDAIREEIELTAQRGYAEDREENEQSIWCYGAAILGADGRAVGCVSISMPMFRREADAQRSYVEPLLAACRAIAARLGPVSAR
ncbi:IclR family transcriptional regulator [Paraburkholderia unamae]|uniref:IclR family transcriptional regulator n=1 Tax=Paraburkholderia unamae TaxID=219649 RepID=A0ABX5K9K9_9BURK|nr:IclR family transcriptional regulator [Paraburkholderia unamae]PVX71455.1 IclR family transcriptional regulator [Paraburkholderia unamae]CAG9274960.1 IclR family transcriptional regulator [Paraburkholderia unamae]